MSIIGGAATFATNMGLAASHDNQSEQNNSFSQTSQTKLRKMGADEKALSEATTGLGMGQTEYLKSLLGGDTFALSPQELAQLNALYDPQMENLRRFGDIMGQDLAGTRGLNTSDTPVSEAVLREVLPAASNLLSNKMQTGLGLGLQRKGLNLQAALGMPGASAFNLQKLFNERLATGRTTTSGFGRQTFNPGFLDRMATTAGAQQGITQAGQNLMGGGSAGGLGTMMSGFSGFSDVRLKENITPVSWDWKSGGDQQFGVIAQQVQQSHPHLVSTDAHGTLMVDYGTMVAMLLSERAWLYSRLKAMGQTDTSLPHQAS